MPLPTVTPDTKVSWLAKLINDLVLFHGGFIEVDEINKQIKITNPNIEALIVEGEDGSYGINILSIRNTVVSFSIIRLQSSRGTLSSQQAVQIGDNLGDIRFQGHDGTQQRIAASILAQVEATFSGTVRDTTLIFRTSKGTSIAEKMRITSDGKIGIGGTPNTKAILDVQSTTLGFLPPRMTTTQRDNITSPPAGLIIYNTTTNRHQGFDGSFWNDFY